jgi:RNA polymerase sigma factor (sigma-70 family)
MMGKATPMEREQTTTDVRSLLVHADWLRRLAGRLVSESDSEDALQDTWMAAMQSLPAGDAAAARPWLGQVMRNFLRRGWRAGAVLRRAETALRFEMATPPSPDELLERGQVQRELAVLVLALEEPFRSAVLLRYYEGQTAAAIARSLRVPAGTIRWRLSEGVRRLRAALDDRHGGAREKWRALVAPLALYRKTAAPAAAGGALVMATSTKVGWTVAAALVVAVLAGLGWWRWGGGVGPEALSPVQTVDRELRRRPATGAASTESAPSGGATIEGTVKDPKGNPVAGAVVALTRAPQLNPTPDAYRPAATARTDAGGHFRFESALPGRYQASAASADWMSVVSPVFGLQASERKRLDLVFRAGGELLEGRVIDEGGGPVPGARVTLSLGYPWTAYMSMAPGPKQPARAFLAVADDEGRYRVRMEPREYELRVEAAGYVPLQTTAAVTRRVIRDLILHPAARLWGRVIERASGKPVPGVRVALSPVQMMGAGYRPTVTDDEGRFQFTDAEAGTFQLVVRDDELNLVGSVARVTLVPLQTLGNVELMVDAGATVSGTVVGADGRPVEGSLVGYRAADRMGPGSGRQLTSPDGAFRLAGLVPGRYQLFADSAPVGSTRAESSIDVPAQGLSGITLKLAGPSDGLTLTGRVLRPDGAPAAGVLVRAEREGRRTGMPAGAAESGPDGSFQMALAAPARTRVVAWHPQDGFAESLVDLSSSSAAPIELRLQSGAVIGGTVKWNDGAPAAGISVAVTRQEGMVVYASATSGEDGRFQIGSLADGRYTVRATRKLGPWNRWTSREQPSLRLIDLGAGERRLDVELIVARGGKRISGTVAWKDGKPAVGTRVIASREENGRAYKPHQHHIEHSGSASEDGRFVIDDVEEGSFTLWADRPGSPEAQQTGVQAGRNDVRIVLKDGASVAGVVVGGDRRPMVDFSIQAVPAALPNETPQQRFTREDAARNGERLQVRDPAGAFELTGLPAGSYELKVTTSTGGATRSVTVAEGERKTGLRLEIGGGARVTGKVVEHGSGAPLAGLRVSSNIAGRWLEAKTNQEGGFELDGVLPGEKVMVQVRPDQNDLVPEEVPAALASGQTSLNVGTIRLLKGDWREQMKETGTTGLQLEPAEGGVRVAGMRDDSPAARAGLKTGELLLAIDGKEIRGLGAGAARYLMGRKPGGTVALTVAPAGGAPRTVNLTAEKRPN